MTCPADTASPHAWRAYARTLSEADADAELLSAELRGCEVARRALLRVRGLSSLAGWSAIIRLPR